MDGAADGAAIRVTTWRGGRVEMQATWEGRREPRERGPLREGQLWLPGLVAAYGCAGVGGSGARVAHGMLKI